MEEQQLSLKEKRSRAGKLGHEARIKKYGSKEYYSALGKRSAAVKKAIKEGKEAAKHEIPLPKEKKGFFNEVTSFLNGKTSS